MQTNVPGGGRQGIATGNCLYPRGCRYGHGSATSETRRRWCSVKVASTPAHDSRRGDGGLPGREGAQLREGRIRRDGGVQSLGTMTPLHLGQKVSAHESNAKAERLARAAEVYVPPHRCCQEDAALRYATWPRGVGLTKRRRFKVEVPQAPQLRHPPLQQQGDKDAARAAPDRRLGRLRSTTSAAWRQGGTPLPIPLARLPRSRGKIHTPDDADDQPTGSSPAPYGTVP
ncbi:uncharacterized protein PSFLO_05179 [Pseudozyma flocculosa]|uniref:Uncharacterized protein n=1 Tax=Pseudozyma flocculosa TaxID=84751 RepID=A0A5C3F5D1_9BASI|nr:uncharacterized protein PSFLO_05179 [Pseudozyma flocculosa]